MSLDVTTVVSDIFGGMLRNAQALEQILIEARIQLPTTDLDRYANALQHISALTTQHEAMIRELRLEQGLNRRHGERRSGRDRRAIG